MNISRVAVSLLLLLAGNLFAGRLDRYALILEGSPAARQASSSKPGQPRFAEDQRQKLIAAQSNVRRALADRNIQVTGAVQTIANAVFVVASEEQAAALRTLPGVAGVQLMRPVKRSLNRAIGLMNVAGAWSALQGEGNAGAGMKIAILDTGIDQTHPAFQDGSLQMPPGFPKCAGQSCGYTNNKVIAARSYVQMLVLPGADSRPDDLSPRDRVGHGTAAASVAAGVRNSGPAVTITGVAPKAFLGNYKIFGSPGVNDVTFTDVVIQALEDAYNDGMDVASLSLGFPAVWGPLDSGSACGLDPGAPCDLFSAAVEEAAQLMVVVVSAGNDGDLGNLAPSLNTIHSPGTAPSAITVGALYNSHEFFSSVRAPGLDRINALFGNGPRPSGSITAPLRAVSRSEDQKACTSLQNNSLTGAVALIERGDCGFDTKVVNAQKAGAVAVILHQSQGSNFVFPPTGLIETGIPAVLIGYDAATRLSSAAASNANFQVTLDPALVEINAVSNQVAYFSSYGPAIGTFGIKPEISATGTDLYMATQKYDPNGDLYDASGYTNAQGTSFAAPIVAGAAALVMQAHPDFNVAQVKSAIVNTASADVRDIDGAGRPVTARVAAVGAGKLDVSAAVRTQITSDAATISFGEIKPGFSGASRSFRLTNSGTNQAQLSVTVTPRDTDPGGRVSIVGETSFTLAPGTRTTNINVRLDLTQRNPGSYEGFVDVKQGPALVLRIPYVYYVPGSEPFNIIPLTGFDFTGIAGEDLSGRLTLKVIDRFGIPVPDLPVQFRATLGGGGIEVAMERTDPLGIADAQVFLGPQLGEQEFSATVSGSPDPVYFPGKAIQKPAIFSNGVVNAASNQVGQGLAPGSLISIYGSALSQAIRGVFTPYLPVSLAGMSVSFDRLSDNISVPGRLHYVSPDQINLQIPWELEGFNNAIMKISIGNISSGTYDVPLAKYSPAFYEYNDAGSGRTLIAALDEGNVLVTPSRPARKNTVVQFYANGLGPVDNRPASGELSPSSPLARTRVVPEVRIGGRPAHVDFSGLAPTFAGLYQINAVVPGDAPSGLQPVEITMEGVTSKTAFLPVE